MASLTQWKWVWVKSGSWWWTGRPGVLQSMGLQRVEHNWVTELNWWERHGNPLLCTCLENHMNRGAWWAAVRRVTQSLTQLKGLSSSSSIYINLKLQLKNYCPLQCLTLENSRKHITLSNRWWHHHTSWSFLENFVVYLRENGSKKPNNILVILQRYCEIVLTL